MNLTNKHDIPLSVAVWLMGDDYDYDPTAISATTLLKPLKQMILSNRVKSDMVVSDLSDFIPSRMGSAIHDSIEQSWVKEQKLHKALRLLGFDEERIARMVVNPTQPLQPKQIPVYLEQRHYKEVDGQKISGKHDFCIEGVLEDFKSTSVYSYISGSKDEQFAMQGSIYRYLAPHIFTEDYMRLTYIFTDWQKARTKEEKYPSARVKPVMIPLKDITETEDFIKSKLALIRQYKDAPESALPRCSDAELWRKPSVYKYYADETKLSGRSTKNFEDASSAYAFKASRGKGIVIEVRGQVRACRYCRGALICTQKDEYLMDGTLILDED